MHPEEFNTKNWMNHLKSNLDAKCISFYRRSMLTPGAYPRALINNHPREEITFYSRRIHTLEKKLKLNISKLEQ
jgi:hypothetical protein